MGKKGNNSTANNSSKPEKMIEMTTFTNLFANENVVKKDNLLKENEKSINSVEEEIVESEIEEKTSSKKKKKEKVVTDINFAEFNEPLPNVFEEQKKDEEKEDEFEIISYKKDVIIEEPENDLEDSNEHKGFSADELKAKGIKKTDEIEIIEEEIENINKIEVEPTDLSNKEEVKENIVPDIRNEINIEEFTKDNKEEKLEEKKDEIKLDEKKVEVNPEEKKEVLDDKKVDEINKEEKVEEKVDDKKVDGIKLEEKKDEIKVEEKKEEINIVVNAEEKKEEKVEEKTEEKPEFTTSAKHVDMPKPSDPKGDLLPKAQKNHLSDMIDQFNENNNTKLSTKGISKYLQNQFFKGQGESVNDKRESFKKSYQDFMIEVYKNMLAKRNDIPANKRPTLEDTQKDFDALAQQIGNMCKANGWMKKDYEIGPCGGLSAETIRKIQKDAIKEGPQSAKELIENQLGKKTKQTTKDKKEIEVVDLTANLKEFSTKFKGDLDKVPNVEKGGMDSPEARDVIMQMQALDNVHASRGLGYRLRHPQLYSQETKLLEESKDLLQKKGYDREVINSLIKNTSLDDNDMVKASNAQDEKNIEKLYKENQKSTREFEEKREKEEHELKQQIKGLRKRITVPEADTINEIVKPKEVSQRVELTVNKQINLEFAPNGNK